MVLICGGVMSHAPTDLAAIDPVRHRQIDWSNWENWLQSHLDDLYEKIMRQMIDAAGYGLSETGAELREDFSKALDIQRDDLRAKIAALKTKLGVLEAKLAQLPAGPPGPPGKMSPAKTWQPEQVFYAGDNVVCDGNTFQARCDTAKAPWTEDWALLAARGVPGKTPIMRGAYNPVAAYSELDCVMCNGSSFIALRDAPGACPGRDWRLMASCGKRGPKGERGGVATIVAWEVASDYTATPKMSDGSAGAALDLHPLLEQFLHDVGAYE